MATKDKFLSLRNNQKNVVNENSNGNQYLNLKLVENSECNSLKTVESATKSCMDKYNDSALFDAGKPKSQLGDILSKNFSAANVKFEAEEDKEKHLKKYESSKTINKSTLSLHIAAFENSFELPSSDFFVTKRLKSDKIFVAASAFVFQNPFEFPRQQQNDDVGEPEVSQFSVSQRLLIPNEAPTNGRQEASLQSGAAPSTIPPSNLAPPSSNVLSVDNDGLNYAAPVTRWPLKKLLSSNKKQNLYGYLDDENCRLFYKKDDQRSTCHNPECTAHWRYTDDHFLDDPTDNHHQSCIPPTYESIEKRQMERAFLLWIQGRADKKAAQHFETFVRKFLQTFGHQFPEQEKISFKKSIRRAIAKGPPSADELAQININFSSEAEAEDAEFDDLIEEPYETGMVAPGIPHAEEPTANEVQNEFSETPIHTEHHDSPTSPPPAKKLCKPLSTPSIQQNCNNGNGIVDTTQRQPSMKPRRRQLPREFYTPITVRVPNFDLSNNNREESSSESDDMSDFWSF